MTGFKKTAIVALLVAGIGFSGVSHGALLETVTYGFDFEITSDTYRGTLSGPLFTSGTHGSGTTTFVFQPISSASGVNYVRLPFDVNITFDGNSLKLIDSSVFVLNGRRGIIVQDIPSNDYTYDTVLFEGFSGSVEVKNEFGTPVTQQLHTQLGLFAQPNTITDYALSETNIQKISNSLIETTFNISDIIDGGQVNGAIMNFRMLPSPNPIPIPGVVLLFSSGLALIAVTNRRKNKKYLVTILLEAK